MADFQIKNLSFAYPQRQMLKNINLHIEQGEYVVICGKSGSGKTTLLRHLKKVLAPFGEKSGEILFNNTPLENVPLEEQALKIGYVYQNPEDQIVTDKVWHELAFGLENLGVDNQTMKARVSEMACYFGIQDWFQRDVALLSGGQKQLLNLASVMAMQPEVLILDEPTGQLDPIAASDFLNTVRKINIELGTTVIITEHRLEDILPYADKAVVLDNGEIIACGNPKEICKELFENKNKMFEAFPTPAKVFYSVNGEGQAPFTVREGRKWLSNTFKNSVNTPSLEEEQINFSKEIAINAKDVWFRYEKNGADIVRGMNISIPKGCTYAIVGGNGAGKSTALKVLCGICKNYKGSIKILNKNIEKYKGKELFTNCLALLPQDPKSLFVKNSLLEDLEEMTKNKEDIKRVSALCKVDHLLSSHAYDLSGGELQRAALAKVLLTNPQILFLDEPTKGIDCFFKEEIASILKNLKNMGITVVLVSHDIEFCAANADLVSMFFDGGVITTNTPRKFFGNNSFYTTAANRMSRHIFKEAVTGKDLLNLYNKNKGE